MIIVNILIHRYNQKIVTKIKLAEKQPSADSTESDSRKNVMSEASARIVHYGAVSTIYKHV